MRMIDAYAALSIGTKTGSQSENSLIKRYTPLNNQTQF